MLGFGCGLLRYHMAPSFALMQLLSGEEFRPRVIVGAFDWNARKDATIRAKEVTTQHLEN